MVYMANDVPAEGLHLVPGGQVFLQVTGVLKVLVGGDQVHEVVRLSQHHALSLAESGHGGRRTAAGQ